MRGMRGLRIGLLGAVAILRTSTARPADAPADDKEACIRAAEDGQHLRTTRKLVAARDAFILCARPECPVLVRKDCAQWLSDARETLPSVVFSARDAQGKDLIDVRVSLDGSVVGEKLDGASVAVDPGPHSFRFEWVGHGSVDQQVVIREGERSRILAVAFPALEGHQRKPIPAAVWIFGALGLAGGGAFAGLALSGTSDIDHLRQTCAPSCAASDVDSARTKIILADVSLGVGIAAVGVAATWLLLSRSPSGTSTAIRVQPTPGGGQASLVVVY